GTIFGDPPEGRVRSGARPDSRSVATQSIAGSNDGFYGVEGGVDGLDLPAQASDVRVDDPLNNDRIVAAHDLQESFARQDDLGAARQGFEQTKLGECERERQAVISGVQTLRVQFETGRADERWRRNAGASQLVATQKRSNASEKNSSTERLGDVVVGA